MVIVLPGYTAIAPSPGAPMISNPFPRDSQFFLLWSAMWEAARPWARPSAIRPPVFESQCPGVQMNALAPSTTAPKGAL